LFRSLFSQTKLEFVAVREKITFSRFVKTMPNQSKKQKPIEDQRTLVSIIMGSRSDWETMQNASDVLRDFAVPHECRIVSAHRTPDLLFEFAKTAEGRGIEVIIAGAGGAAHLPGMCAAQTVLPVLGVPVQSKTLIGLDSLLSIVQMPAGIPVGTLAIGAAGAKNAALLAVSILANSRPELKEKLKTFRREQTLAVLNADLPQDFLANPESRIQNPESR
jgi:5-(carboxyamino)imidazole ribonucleotide mutase